MSRKESFLQKYHRDLITGCWNWSGSLSSNNRYGKFSKPLGGWEYAHRYSWELFMGAIPKGICVLHKCDNPKCVNPEHLFLGTQKDNVRDMISKHRQANFKGENHPRHKLCEEDIKIIRVSKASNKLLSQMFKVDASVISKIRRNKIWRIDVTSMERA